MISHRTMGRLKHLEEAVGIKSLEFHKFSSPGRIEKLEAQVAELLEKVETLTAEPVKRGPGRPRKQEVA